MPVAGKNESESALALREMHCTLNALSRPDGSAIYSQGNTVVAVGVYGPFEGKVQNYDVYKAVIEVAFTGRTGFTCVRERLRETNIKQICENAVNVSAHPRDSISINIQEMEDAGCITSTIVNACCLALINSGVSMKYLFAAVQCAVKGPGQVVIIDPAYDEVDETMGNLTFVFDSIDKNVISTTTIGIYSPRMYQEALNKCREASEKVFEFYRSMVEKYSTIVK